MAAERGAQPGPLRRPLLSPAFSCPARPTARWPKYVLRGDGCGRGTFTAIESGGLDEDGDGLDAFPGGGEVAAGRLGIDCRFREDLLAGVAVSRTAGGVEYAFEGDSDRGRVERP